MDKNKAVMGKFVEFINMANEKLAAEVVSEKAIFYATTKVNVMNFYRFSNGIHTSYLSIFPT